MKQTLWWILILGPLAFLGLKGYLDVPLERARTAMWVSINLTSAGSQGSELRQWFEQRGYQTREVDELIVARQVGPSRVAMTQGDHFWNCTVIKKRPLGEMRMEIYVAENLHDTFLDYWMHATVSGRS